MNVKKYFWFFLVGTLFLLISITLSYFKKLEEPPIKVLLKPAQENTDLEFAKIHLSDLGLEEKTEQNSEKTKPESKTRCQESPTYKKWRESLGRLVNNQEKRSQKKKFIKELNAQMQNQGLPLPIKIEGNVIEKSKLVTRCKPICGQVFLAFIKGIDKNKNLIFTNTQGKKSQWPIYEKGITLATIDEVNNQGVPFRSWVGPASEGSWFIDKDKIYLQTDIFNVWLQIDTKNRWSLVERPKDLSPLVKMESIQVPGCQSEETCFEVKSDKTRYFKTPKLCK